MRDQDPDEMDDWRVIYAVEAEIREKEAEKAEKKGKRGRR